MWWHWWWKNRYDFQYKVSKLSWKKLVEDDNFREQLAEIEVFEVTHYLREKLWDNEKKEKVYRELIRQGYLE